MTDITRYTGDMDPMTLGEVLAKSGYFQNTTQTAQAVVKVLAGRELGIPPIAAMTGIHVIEGKISLSANLIASVIRRSGVYDYYVVELTRTACELGFVRNGKEIGASKFTIQDAQQAGLAGGKNWQKYPQNMLFARAMSNGAKWYCPDIFAGPVYTPDELGAEVDGESGNVIDAQPQAPQQAPAPVITEVQAEPERLLTDTARIEAIKRIEAMDKAYQLNSGKQSTIRTPLAEMDDQHLLAHGKTLKEMLEDEQAVIANEAVA